MDRPPTVLVVLPNWLGDVIMATPMLDRLAAVRDHRGRPLRLVGVVREAWAPLLEGDPRLDDVLRYERRGCHAGLGGLVRLAKQWRGVGADVTVLCPPSFRVALVGALARAGQTVGYRGDGRGWLLGRPLAPVEPRGARHHVEELVALADEALGCLGLVPAPVPVTRPGLPHLLERPPLDPGDGPPVWVLAPGATYGSAKAWPPQRVAEFLHLAVLERGVRVAVVGDLAGRAITEAIREQTRSLPWRSTWDGEAGVVDLVGETSLLDLVAVLRAARAFVGNDSGVMHLAAALDVPTVGVFGSSSVAWTAPRGRRARALAATGFACQPCFRPTCDQPRFCLDTIDGASALAALDELLEESS